MPMLAAVAGLLAVVPAAPAVAGGNGADYVVWRLLSPGPRGLVMMRDGASNTTMVAHTAGLTPNTSYRYVGSTASCSVSHQPSNAVWAKAFESNAKGASLINPIMGDDDLVPWLRSIRLFRGSSQVDCANSMPYQSNSGSTQPTDAFATLNAFGARATVLVDLGRGSDKLTAIGHGFIASHGFRLVAVDAACPAQPVPGTTLFQRSGTTNPQGIMWVHDTSQNLASEAPRSIQLFNGSNRVACSNTTLLPAVP